MLKTTLAGCMALGFAGFAACGDDEPRDDQPTAAEYDEVATTMGALVAGRDNGEVSAMGNAVLFARGQGDPSLDLDLDGSFIGTKVGLSFSFDVDCEGAGGEAVDCGDDAATASVQASWDAQWDGDRLDASTALDADWTLSGLQGPTIFLDGSSSASAEVDIIERDGDLRHWSVAYDASYEAVGFDDHRPVSGRASFSIDIEKAVEGEPDRTFVSNVQGVVTFTGDGRAVLQLDGSAQYDIDLGSGDVSRR